MERPRRLSDHQSPSIGLELQDGSRNTFGDQGVSCGRHHSLDLVRAAHAKQAWSSARPARCTSTTLLESLEEGRRFWEQGRPIGLVQPILGRFVGQEAMISQSGDQHPHPPNVEDRILTIHHRRKGLASALRRKRSLRYDDDELELLIEAKPNDVHLTTNGAGTDQASDDAGRGILGMSIDAGGHSQWVR